MFTWLFLSLTSQIWGLIMAWELFHLFPKISLVVGGGGWRRGSSGYKHSAEKEVWPRVVRSLNRVHAECGSSQKPYIFKEIRWVNSGHTSFKPKWRDTFNSFCYLWANTGSRGTGIYWGQVLGCLWSYCLFLCEWPLFFPYVIQKTNAQKPFRISVSFYSRMNILVSPMQSQATHGNPRPETVA